MWRARVRQISALVIASHNGNEALVTLLESGSDVHEMGVASINPLLRQQRRELPNILLLIDDKIFCSFCWTLEVI